MSATAPRLIRLCPRAPIRGYAIVFDTLSEDLGEFREIIVPAAVDRTLAESIDVRALVDHDPSKVLGRRKAGTLTLRRDTRGLLVEITHREHAQVSHDLFVVMQVG